MRFLWGIRRGVGGSGRHRSAARGAARAGARAGQVLLPGLLVRGRGLMPGGHSLLEEVNPAELALELDGPTPPLLVDVRTAEERASPPSSPRCTWTSASSSTGRPPRSPRTRGW